LFVVTLSSTMSSKKKGGASKKAVAAAPNPLFTAKKRSFGIGGDIPGKRDLGRFVKWPKYVRLQRQQRVLYKRLKIPPAINQFTSCLDKNGATELFRLLAKYRPEDRAAKKARLLAQAESKDAKGAPQGDKPVMVKYGLNHVVGLIENKKAKMVCIAHDVEPIELVVFLPALCRKFDVPYCIVKSKSRLGQVVHKKTATCLAITDLRPADVSSFGKLKESIFTNFNSRHAELNKRWGGGIMGMKTVHKVKQYESRVAKEKAAREG